MWAFPWHRRQLAQRDLRPAERFLRGEISLPLFAPGLSLMSSAFRLTLLFVSILACPVCELPRHFFDHCGRRPLEDCFERGIELVLQFFGNALGALCGAVPLRVRREGAASLIVCPRHLPDRFQQIAAALPAFALDRFVDFLHLNQRDTETERVTDIATDVRSRHGK